VGAGFRALLFRRDLIDHGGDEDLYPTPRKALSQPDN
jgi:hypothetical protein